MRKPRGCFAACWTNSLSLTVSRELCFWRRVGDIPPCMDGFRSALQENELELQRTPLEVIQVNLGKLCNQVCRHCHVEAGPHRSESMSASTADRLLQLLTHTPQAHTVDFTGGAPELNPNFRNLVTEIRKLGKTVIDRCNLTVFFESGQETLPQFLADHAVVVTASLPCYTSANVDKQRGKGVFAKSIEALQILNSLGYGDEKSQLRLNLVYNPIGPSLPPPQETLEEEYKKKLNDDFGIIFNQLFCLANMPIKRFREDLVRQGKLENYGKLLEANFNPKAAVGVMCRNLISVSWDGGLYDCDFNQMLELPLPVTQTLWTIDSFETFNSGDITFSDHCFGCTAGSGSSCSGKTA